MRAPRIALAGGGTGGHLFPGLAVAKRLLRAGDRPLLYGSGKALEREWVGERARSVRLDAPLLPRGGRQVPRFAWRLSRAVLECLREIRVERPDLVVGLGGYASVAPGLAALMTGRPVLLLEQNAVPGKANRFLAGMGGFLAASYGESLDLLPQRARARARVLGNPVRGDLFRGVRDPDRFGLDPDRPILLAMGGSQGARGLNEAVLQSADGLARRGAQLLFLTGRADEVRARAALRVAGVRAWVRAFEADMGAVYRTADLVLCRAGGTTLAELAALGRPAVLVPYPHHADRHQERNAAVFVRAGAARMVSEEDLTVRRLEGDVLDLLEDRAELERMAAAARGLGVPDAAERVAHWARELIGR